MNGPTRPSRSPLGVAARCLLVALVLMCCWWLTPTSTASAAPASRSATRSNATGWVLAPFQAPPSITVPTPTPPGAPTTSPATDDKVSVDIDLGSLAKDSDPTATGENRKPSKSIVIFLLLTLLAVVPSLLICLTSFTRIIVVLSIARNAIGLQSVPPNQVLTGLALFLSLFVMAPVLKQMNDQGLQPYLRGDITQSQAMKKAETPLKKFMLANTRKPELNLMMKASGTKPPKDPMRLSLTTVIPAFILSELKSAFIIGVMVLLPFLIIDLVVSSGLMSLGMMMLPPVFVSLPFKLLLFVMVDGWALIAHSLIANYHH
ncbi:MAG: flagellar type III secretion system pore protein FliP [Microthrixaceae bacterium]